MKLNLGLGIARPGLPKMDYGDVRAWMAGCRRRGHNKIYVSVKVIVDLFGRWDVAFWYGDAEQDHRGSFVTPMDPVELVRVFRLRSSNFRFDDYSIETITEFSLLELIQTALEKRE